ncbi:hypothetical protein [Oscillibacter sp.]|uniref:hypothetical protein n=1 Tax=Oscillibacter sp. TaxID=1945593 RepID=UPI0028978745|nr:hypothetical protein [Oscillibacter sp.]
MSAHQRHGKRRENPQRGTGGGICCTTDTIILGTGLELAQEKELVEKFCAASPEEREATRAALENEG